MAKKRGGKLVRAKSNSHIHTEDYLLFLKILIPVLAITWLTLMAYVLASYFRFGYLNIILYIVVGLFLLMLLLLITHYYHSPKEVREKEKEGTKSVQRDDVSKVLKITDDLLGELPESTIEKFSRSDDFELYRKVLKEHGVK